MNGWIGVDLDGTLATYDGWKGADHIGDPVPAMVERVKAWVAGGQEVRVFTARVSLDNPGVAPDAVRFVARAIEDWCELHIGVRLPITNTKDYGMIELWDDRAVTVEPNTGKVICHPAAGWTP
jgi:hypothetical protein